MHSRMMSLIIVASAFAPSLMAQDPHFGLGLNLVFPTGEYRSYSFPSYVQPGVDQTDGYDLGIGGQFTISIPVDSHLAIRMNFGGQSTSGTNTEPGYEAINLRHGIFSLGGELQLFPGMGSATQHRGTYLLGGISADFERFDRSNGIPNWDETVTERKSRMGGVLGVGHSFGYYPGGRFTLEGVFHKTLNGNRVSAGDPPSTDFVKVTMGWVF